MDRSVLPRQKSIYREFRIPRLLKEIALKLWSFRAKAAIGGRIAFSLLPDFTTSIVYIRNPAGKSELFVYGPAFNKILLEYESETEAVGIRLKPQVVLKNLNSGKPVPLNTIESLINSKKGDLFARLENSRSAGNSLKILSNYLSINADTGPGRNEFVMYVLDTIQSSHGNCRLEEIYDKLKISRRQLQRVFKKYCQMPPKEFLKLVRIHNATRELVKSGYDHSGVISGLGYYDQSHYYKDFRDLLGINPTAFELRQRALKHENLVD